MTRHCSRNFMFPYDHILATFRWKAETKGQDLCGGVLNLSREACIIRSTLPCEQDHFVRVSCVRHGGGAAIFQLAGEGLWQENER